MNKPLTFCILTLLTFKMSGMDLQKKIAEQEVSALDLGLAYNVLHTSPKLKPQFPKVCSNLKVCTTTHMPEFDTREYHMMLMSMNQKNNNK